MKIICPAPSKTGTVSLTRALERFGLSVSHYPHDLQKTRLCLSDCSKVDVLLSGFDAITDLPASVFWLDLLKKYDDALVIVMQRELISWIESMSTHYEKNKPWQDEAGLLLRTAMYGCADFNEEKIIVGRGLHYKRLYQYYSYLPAEYSDNWLWMRLEDHDDFKWAQLRFFLERKGINLISDNWPKDTFPRENVTNE